MRNLILLLLPLVAIPSYVSGAESTSSSTAAAVNVSQIPTDHPLSEVELEALGAALIQQARVAGSQAPGIPVLTDKDIPNHPLTDEEALQLAQLALNLARTCDPKAQAAHEESVRLKAQAAADQKMFDADKNDKALDILKAQLKTIDDQIFKLELEKQKAAELKAQLLKAQSAAGHTNDGTQSDGQK
jgi:hypothetical protein